MMAPTIPWQLLMFKKTLKKKLRLGELKKILTSIQPGRKCLLITCGDNNGAMNYHLRELGGTWSWADLESTNLTEMSELLGEEVKHAYHDKIPYSAEYFDHVISIDVHEHLEDPNRFTRELWRVTKNEGHVLITVPGGDRKKFVNMMKSMVGMTKEKYGHVKDGYSAAELKEIMLSANIKPTRERTFSKFFTELIEFGINFLFVNVLSKKKTEDVKEGTIAPQTKDQLKSVEKTYRLYSFIYPFIWIFSQLDHVLFFTSGYVVIVEGEKR